MSSLRNIPSIDELLLQDEIRSLGKEFNHEFIANLLRRAVGIVREELRKSQAVLEKAAINHRILAVFNAEIHKSARGTLQTVINATGVVLHTNLGRAVLSNRAIEYMVEMAGHYNNLEMDLPTGERGSRYVHVEQLLKEITGAEAALVVNNNAAAVMLGLNTLAAGKEAIVSRGQLVEIGGAFRIPEVMKLSGAILKEVGTTNKTYNRDYEQAINENTALLFAAHTSNYKIEGFTAEVALQELVELGNKYALPVMQDLGSGILYPMQQWGLREEPTVQECVKSGADIITFSGDKLLGGPQAGIILGKKPLIEAMKENQLTRALRVDKLTIAALEGTLLEYLSGNPAVNIPVLRMLCQSPQELLYQAQQLYKQANDQLLDHTNIETIEIVEVEDMVGGGAYPTYRIPGWGVAIKFQGITLDQIAGQLRLTQPALLTRRQDDKMLISVRTLQVGEDEQIMGLIQSVLQN
ncbi:MAG: L-seryl-tRNA(Sec) selenium transferase [Syntrophomonadaceae bacterium]|nr:L-seryl-tRNA(Sec) selenium transferase [Syntrophomonadaceae bacterium]